MSEAFNFEVEQIRSACGGKWLQKADKPPRLKGVGIDGREGLDHPPTSVLGLEP